VGQCRKHLGNAPNQQAHARRVQAEEACRRFGVPVEVSPETALLDEVYASRGVVEFYRERVRSLAPDAMVYGTESVRRTRRPAGGDGEGDVIEDIMIAKPRPNVWITLLQQAEAHHLDVVRAAVGIGIEKRVLDIIEEQAATLHRVIEHALSSAGLDAAGQQAVRAAIPAAIRLVTGGRDAEDAS
jgi:hypothetical protein